MPRAIFDPEIISRDEKPLHELIKEAVLGCDLNIRKDLLSNIILGGGNSLIKGFAETLKNKLEMLLSRRHKEVGCFQGYYVTKSSV